MFLLTSTSSLYFCLFFLELDVSFLYVFGNIWMHLSIHNCLYEGTHFRKDECAHMCMCMLRPKIDIANLYWSFFNLLWVRILQSNLELVDRQISLASLLRDPSLYLQRVELQTSHHPAFAWVLGIWTPFKLAHGTEQSAVMGCSIVVIACSPTEGHLSLLSSAYWEQSFYNQCINVWIFVETWIFGSFDYILDCQTDKMMLSFVWNCLTQFQHDNHLFFFAIGNDCHSLFCQILTNTKCCGYFVFWTFQ